MSWRESVSAIGLIQIDARGYGAAQIGLDRAGRQQDSDVIREDFIMTISHG